jgi:hypothetical protein
MKYFFLSLSALALSLCTCNTSSEDDIVLDQANIDSSLISIDYIDSSELYFPVDSVLINGVIPIYGPLRLLKKLNTKLDKTTPTIYQCAYIFEEDGVQMKYYSGSIYETTSEEYFARTLDLNSGVFFQIFNKKITSGMSYEDIKIIFPNKNISAPFRVEKKKNETWLHIKPSLGSDDLWRFYFIDQKLRYIKYFVPC